MARSKILAILIALSAGAASAQPVPPTVAPPSPQAVAPVPPCRPKSLVSMTVRNVTPGLQASDPGAQPKRLWRKGEKFLRSLDQPVVSRALQDPKAPMARQALVIVAEPDVWMIDMASREGRHSVDKGPVLEVRAPIFGPGTAPPEFMGLEYGCEAEFVAIRAPLAKRNVRWGGVDARIHTYIVGTASLAILLNDRTSEPLIVTYVRDGRPITIISYDEYRRDQPDQPELFRPPADVKITEAEAPLGARPLD
jgi:hypothetical protein